jgi:membrane protease YdiL (CAAX protease family)
MALAAAYPAAPPSYPAPPPVVLDEKDKRWLKADWSLKAAGIALLVVFGLYAVVGLVVVLLTEDYIFYSSLVYIAVLCPLITLSCWFVVKRKGRGWRELGFKWGDPKKTITYGGLGAVGALVVSLGIMLLIILVIYLLGGSNPLTADAEQVETMAGGQLLVSIAVAVIFAPIFEELFFRGMFYPPLRRSLGPTLAVIIDGIIFGALHMQYLSIVSLILVGMILTYVYEKTESLYAPILTHALYNGFVVFISLLMGWPLF